MPILYHIALLRGLVGRWCCSRSPALLQRCIPLLALPSRAMGLLRKEPEILPISWIAWSALKQPFKFLY